MSYPPSYILLLQFCMTCYLQMPISLRAKASLMELMVDKTTSLYATEIQTNQVKTRRELLNLNPK